MTATYGDMIDRIADELNRSDLETQIKRAIISATNHYEGERFWWTVDRDTTFSLTSSQEFYLAASYTALGQLASIDTAIVTLNGDNYPLVKRTWAWIDNINTGTTFVGIPDDYAYAIDQIRLYPVPNQGMTLRLTGVLRQSTLSATGDANAWTDGYKGEEMIRSRAKVDLLENVLMSSDPARIAMNRQREMDAYRRNKGRTASREGTGHIVPTRW